MPAIRQFLLTVSAVILSLLSAVPHSNADYCGTVTQWLEKTIYRPVPVYNGGKASRDHYAPVHQTITVINTQSVPYFVTQTQNVPQFVTRKAILPQYITHTVVRTQPKYVTVTEKSYVTVTATRTRKTYETVCPKKKHVVHKGYH